jgi:hypothetical protein
VAQDESLNEQHPRRGGGRDDQDETPPPPPPEAEPEHRPYPDQEPDYFKKDRKGDTEKR